MLLDPGYNERSNISQTPVYYPDQGPSPTDSEELEVEAMLFGSGYSEMPNIFLSALYYDYNCPLDDEDPCDSIEYRRSMSEDRDMDGESTTSIERDGESTASIRAAEALGIKRDQALYHPLHYDLSIQTRRRLREKCARGGPLVCGLHDYELKWRAIEDCVQPTLDFSSVPWPVYSIQAPTVGDITKSRVMAFFMYSVLEPYTLCLYSNPSQLRTIVLRNIRTRWVQGKFSRLVLSRINSLKEAEEVHAAGEVVLKALTEMMLPDFWDELSARAEMSTEMPIVYREPFLNMILGTRGSLDY